MLSDAYYERISDDWLWREREMRELDARLLRARTALEVKSAILILYGHWEGHFKFCASELLGFMSEGVKRKMFKWTDFRPDVRLRILFCSYRRSSLSGQKQETFISHLNAINDGRYLSALTARDEVIMIDDNLSAARAEAICRNLGVDHRWCALKRIIIDERILEHRNAIAHGAKRLRSGDELDFLNNDLTDALVELRHLIRQAKDNFQNAITLKEFLIQTDSSPLRSLAPPSTV